MASRSTVHRRPLDFAERLPGGGTFAARVATFWPRLVANLRAIATGDDDPVYLPTMAVCSSNPLRVAEIVARSVGSAPSIARHMLKVAISFVAYVRRHVACASAELATHMVGLPTERSLSYRSIRIGRARVEPPAVIDQRNGVDEP